MPKLDKSAILKDLKGLQSIVIGMKEYDEGRVNDLCDVIEELFTKLIFENGKPRMPKDHQFKYIFPDKK